MCDQFSLSKSVPRQAIFQNVSSISNVGSTFIPQCSFQNQEEFRKFSFVEWQVCVHHASPLQNISQPIRFYPVGLRDCFSVSFEHGRKGTYLGPRCRQLCMSLSKSDEPRQLSRTHTHTHTHGRVGLRSQFFWAWFWPNQFVPVPSPSQVPA